MKTHSRPRPKTASRTALTCQKCGSSFALLPSAVAYGRGHYCSRECSDSKNHSQGYIEGMKPASFWH